MNCQINSLRFSDKSFFPLVINNPYGYLGVKVGELRHLFSCGILPERSILSFL